MNPNQIKLFENTVMNSFKDFEVKKKIKSIFKKKFLNYQSPLFFSQILQVTQFITSKEEEKTKERLKEMIEKKLISVKYTTKEILYYPTEESKIYYQNSYLPTILDCNLEEKIKSILEEIPSKFELEDFLKEKRTLFHFYLSEFWKMQFDQEIQVEEKLQFVPREKKKPNKNNLIANVNPSKDWRKDSSYHKNLHTYNLYKEISQRYIFFFILVWFFTLRKIGLLE